MELCSTYFYELSKCIHDTVRHTSISTFAAYLKFLVKRPEMAIKMAVNRTGYKLAAMLTDIIQVSP